MGASRRPCRDSLSVAPLTSSQGLPEMTLKTGPPVRELRRGDEVPTTARQQDEEATNDETIEGWSSHVITDVSHEAITSVH